MTNRKRIIKGVFWSGIERFSVQIIQFIISVILARILLPEDFGLLAIVLVFINILQIINEVGFMEALIHKLDRDELDYSTVFIFNIILGCILYLFVFIGAPLISKLFIKYDISYLIRLLGLNIIISSFVIVQRARFYINVDFKTQAKISFISVVISGIIGVFLAYSGLGVLTLVIQTLLNNLLNTILIWILSNWKPSLKFSYIRFVGLFSYAYKLIISRFVNSVFQEVYSLIIGSLYLPAQLGYYNRAKSLIDISSGNISSIVQRVSTPLLCELQNDKKKMGELLIYFIKNTSFLVFPILFGIFILADPLIRVVLTDKWIHSVWMLQVLCPTGLIYVISTFNRNIFNATGRTDLALKSEIIKKIIYLFIIITAIFISFEALIFSQILISIIELIISSYYTKKQIGLTLIEQIKSIKSIIIISSIMSLIVFLSTMFISNIFLKLLFGIVIGVIIYFSITYFFNICDFKVKVKKVFK